MRGNTITVARDQVADRLRKEMSGFRADVVESAIRRASARIALGDTRLYNSDLCVWIVVIGPESKGA